MSYLRLLFLLPMLGRLLLADTGGTGEPPTDPPTDPPADPPAEDTTDWKAEAEKHQALSRKHEARAKSNADAVKELADLKRSQMNEQQKAVEEAKTAGRTEAMRDVGGRLLSAEFRALAAGRQVNGKALDVTALVEGLNVSHYLSDTGEVDTDKVTKFLDGIAPKPDTGGTGGRFPDLAQGSRTGENKPSVARGRELFAASRGKSDTKT